MIPYQVCVELQNTHPAACSALDSPTIQLFTWNASQCDIRQILAHQSMQESVLILRVVVIVVVFLCLSGTVDAVRVVPRLDSNSNHKVLTVVVRPDAVKLIAEELGAELLSYFLHRQLLVCDQLFDQLDSEDPRAESGGQVFVVGKFVVLTDPLLILKARDFTETIDKIQGYN